MSGTWIALAALGAAALAYVVAPLLRRDAAEAERLADAASVAQELQSRREMLLAALKDLDDDRSTDKIGDADYEELRDKLTQQAVETMKRIDELQRSPRPIRHPRASRP